MSFRFVGTALGIVSATTASGLYMVSGTPASMDGTINPPPAVIVPVERPVPPPVVTAPPLPPPQATAPPAAFMPSPPPTEPAGAMRRAWVYPGTNFNPWTGEPLTREEKESGWVEAPALPPREPWAASHPPAPPEPAVAEVVSGIIPPEPMAPASHKERQAKPPKPPKPAAPAEATTPPAEFVRNGYSIHLATFRSEAGARSGWNALRQRTGHALDGLQWTTVRNKSHKGIMFRLLAGPFPDAGAAENACVTLKTQKVYCRTVPPGGNG